MSASARPGPDRSSSLDEDDARIPALILLLTGVAGLVDAVSYLAFDRAFAATQTGNLVFLGLATARTPGFVVLALATALLGFMAGALVTGRILLRGVVSKARLFRVFTAAQFVPVALAAGLQGCVPALVSSIPVTILLGLLAFAMGIQASGTNRLGIPGLERTTVLTTTITLVAADSFTGKDTHARSVRWIASILALVAGATLGAELYSRLGLLVPLILAAALVGIAASSAVLFDLRPRRATSPDPQRMGIAP